MSPEGMKTGHSMREGVRLEAGNEKFLLLTHPTVCVLTEGLSLTICSLL